MHSETGTSAGEIRIRMMEPGAWRLQVHRPSAQLLADLGGTIGCELPERPGRGRAAGLSVIWLAPGEWLLLGDGAPSRLAIAATCNGQLQAYHDVSDEIVEFAIEGSGAATLLNLGCGLDLGHVAFPAGSATRTLFAQVGVVLERLDGDAFRMIVDRSYGRYVEQWLAETARDAAPRVD